MAEEMKPQDMPTSEQFNMATENLMSADPDIQTVLVSRLSQMSEQELQALDKAITPEVNSALMKLLPELQELITMIGQNQEMPREEMEDTGMPKDMGALGNME
tara:strand:- start:826 stop:1134 length:309 start_codon:yes stop_codon:yes gene_type:complete